MILEKGKFYTCTEHLFLYQNIEDIEEMRKLIGADAYGVESYRSPQSIFILGNQMTRTDIGRDLIKSYHEFEQPFLVLDVPVYENYVLILAGGNIGWIHKFLSHYMNLY